jgi:hypothetical protein
MKYGKSSSKSNGCGVDKHVSGNVTKNSMVKKGSFSNKKGKGWKTL